MTFDRALWERARPLFDELIELDTAARAARLEHIGKTDPTLRSAVERLLRADPGEESDSAPDATSSKSSMPADSRDPLRLTGKNVSHFRVNAFLAAGGMGVVYTAEDLQLGRAVALKFPLPHQQMDLVIKERFINEARSAASLDHPNLCTVHEIAESEHGVFLAMPLYPGETLKDRLAREGSLPPNEALDIIRQITTGLASAHAVGIVHRDLKPGNIMLLPDGTVKVLDFGLAKIRDISLTMSHAPIGTIGYVSPEQIRGKTVDARTDLWSIGVMLHEMLTGTLPFRGEHEVSILHDILHVDPEPPSRLNQNLAATFDRQFDQLVYALLQKDRMARYSSAAALLADIDSLRRGGSLAYRSPFWTRTPRRRRVRARAGPVTAAGALFVALGVLSWITYRPHRGGAAPARPRIDFVHDSATISTAAELLAAMSPANAGKRIHLRAGTYDIDRLLTVPDGMTLDGEGVMTFAREGHATGFRPGPRTTLRMRAATAGDLLTLGNNVTLRGLEIVDREGRSGNLVKVESRRTADTLSASIIESVLLNPNASGPLNASRGLHLSSRNANAGADPTPDDGAVVSVKLLRSVIKSPAGGSGFLAANFAPNSTVSFEISFSLVEGINTVTGGVSRPDAVHDSQVRLTSAANVYRNSLTDRCAVQAPGWNLTGGAGGVSVTSVPATTRNRVIVQSTNDLIEGFTTGILATGSRRFQPSPVHGASNDNHVELQLIGTRISTADCRSGVTALDIYGRPMPRMDAVADLRLIGGSVPRDGFEPGDGNTIRAELRGVTGSGKRANWYGHSGLTVAPFPLRPEFRGKGNRLEIVGDLQTFNRVNHGIDPSPGPEFFTRTPEKVRSARR